jgi:hypothetical protein
VSIFSNRKLQVRRQLSDTHLFARILPYWLAVLGLLVAWSADAQPDMIESVDQVAHTYKYECRSSTDAFKWALIALHAVLLVWAIYLTAESRVAPSSFSDAKTIAVCIYNVAFLSVVLVLIDSLVSLTPDAEFFLTSIGLLLCAVVTFAILGAYKIYQLKTDTGTDSGPSRSGIRPSRARPSVTGMGTTVSAPPAPRTRARSVSHGPTPRPLRVGVSLLQPHAPSRVCSFSLLLLLLFSV